MLQYKRGRRKVLADYKSDEIYTFYSKKYNNPVDRVTYSKILKQFFTEVINCMIYENLEFVFPARLGTLRIKKKLVRPKINEDGELDIRNLSINWKKTKEHWAEIYAGKTPEEIKELKEKPLIRELNEHTDGYRYVWYWDKLTSNVPNQSAYSLDMTREYDRLLSRAAKTVNNLDYYE